ncbi:hypothetical protein F3Y22_tig00111837pilonHSYRG00601 [Hibiscus syriacus]|uniref:Uncharacterized protein n=1 Tax=Hibiscus syriacus TaxID=106335 RepID=A0A6A2YC37_HIBSY|nr:hypothetical protein F3Y22_tig00111837pilonHSYRG00601 [Hibiscus syriacus]
MQAANNETMAQGFLKYLCLKAAPRIFEVSVSQGCTPSVPPIVVVSVHIFRQMGKITVVDIENSLLTEAVEKVGYFSIASELMLNDAKVMEVSHIFMLRKRDLVPSRIKRPGMPRMPHERLRKTEEADSPTLSYLYDSMHRASHCENRIVSGIDKTFESDSSALEELERKAAIENKHFHKLIAATSDGSFITRSSPSSNSFIESRYTWGNSIDAQPFPGTFCIIMACLFQLFLDRYDPL